MKKYYYHRYSSWFKITNNINPVTDDEHILKYVTSYGKCLPSKYYTVRLMNPTLVNMLDHNIHDALKDTFTELVFKDIARIDKIQNKIHKK